MASPPKPWERPGAAPASSGITAAASTTSTLPTSSTPVTSSAATTGSIAPALPAMPMGLASTVNQNAATYSRLGVGASPYGGYGTGYSTPYSGGMYSRMGGYGGYGSGMYGGGYGGYGGMYGGGMYGGMPGAIGAGGAGGDPNDPNSLTNRFNTSTQATFQMLEGIVGAFGGFAQMLESTYMATHSSFFAMVSVAEQFGNLRDTLGSVLGIFTLMRWIRTLIAKLTGRPPPVDATSLTPAAFARFEGRSAPVAHLGPDGHPRPSRKPLLFFVLAAFGLPYVMSKVIRSLAHSHEEEERRRMALAAEQQQQQQQQAMDPTRLDFCRVLYDFTPPGAVPGAGGSAAPVPGVDLEVNKGDFVAVLSRTDPLGNPSDWWRCRSRDGRMGYLPSNYLELMSRKGAGDAGAGTPAAKAIKGAPASEGPGGSTTRASSLTSSVSAPAAVSSGAGAGAALAGGGGVAALQKQQQEAPQRPPALPQSKVGDITPESFQKSQFYS